MKKTRKLIPAIAMLLTSTVMMSTASFAWFSMNQEVSATGMEVKAKATGALVINSTWDSEHTTLGNDRTVTFSGAKTLAPITYKDITPEDGNNNPTYAYVTNAEIVDPDTGAAESGSLKYAEVGGTDGQPVADSYADYLVYISTAGDVLTGYDLDVEVTLLTSLTLTQKAVKIDFWVGGTGNETVTTYLNAPSIATPFTNATLAHTVKADETTTYTKTDLVSNVIIPKYDAEGTDAAKAIPVLMRVYFDGDEGDDSASGKKYIRNAGADFSSALSISVTFKAVQHS